MTFKNGAYFMPEKFMSELIDFKGGLESTLS
jgi:hypothetical protein